MSGFGALYRIGVGVNLKDSATAGLRKMVGELRATGKEAERLKKEIGNIGRKFGGAKSMDEARRKMAELGKLEADIRTKSATSERTQDLNRYRRQLQGIDLTRKQLGAQMKGLSIEEKATRTQEAAQRKAAYAATVRESRDAKEYDAELSRVQRLGQERERIELRLAAQNKREAERKQAREAKAEREYRTYLNAVERQQARTQQAAERSAIIQAREQAKQTRAGSNYANWWGTALNRQDQHKSREQHREQTRQTRTASKQQKQDHHNIQAAGAVVQNFGNQSGVAGIAAIGTATYATEQAAKYQQETVETLLPFGYERWSPDKQRKHVREMQREASSASRATGYFSEQQIMEGMKSVATNGANQLGFDTFRKLTPAISQYMDVVGRLKNENSIEAAQQAMEYAHMIGATTPKQLSQGLNQAASLSLITGHDMGTALSTLQYLYPVAHSLGKQGALPSLALYASLDQSGQGGGHVGARTKDLIEAFTTRGTPDSKHAHGSEWYREQLGFQNARNADGSLDSVKMIQVLMKDSFKFNKIDPKTKLNQYSTYMKKALGEQDLPTALWLGDPSGNGLQRYLKNYNYIQGGAQRGDLDKIQNTLKTTTMGSQRTTQTQTQNLITEFGRTGIPIMDKFFTNALRGLDYLNRAIDAHPKRSEGTFNAVVYGGAALLGIKGITIASKWIYEFAKGIVHVSKGIASGARVLASWGPKIEKFGKMVASWGPKAMSALQAIRIALIPVLEGIAAIGAPELVAAAAAIGALVAVLKNAQGLENWIDTNYDKVFGQGASDWRSKVAPSGPALGPPRISELHAGGASTIGTINLNFSLPPGSTDQHADKIMKKVHGLLRTSRSTFGRTGDNPTNLPLQSRLSYGFAAGAK